MSEKKTEKLEPASASVEQKALATADSQEARNADAAQLAQVQDSNPNKHSGSAGGDHPHKSIEVVGLDYVISRDSKLTGKDVAVIEARRSSISRDELREKAQSGDGQARDLLKYFVDAEKLPPGAARERALAEQQRNADRIYGRGDFATRKQLTDVEPKRLSDSGAELQTRALDNPVLAPVANLRAYADGLPDGEQKDRLVKLSKEQEALLVAQTPVLDTRDPLDVSANDEAQSADYLPLTAGKPLEGFIANDEHTQEVEEPLTNSPEGWQKVVQKISELPFDKQCQVIGAGLMAGIEQYQWEQREREIGSLIGTVQGVGTVAENLAKVADFGAALILNDKEKAGKLGEEFGTAIGQTIIGGVQLFRMADKYLYDVGYTGDYQKPFRDIVTLGQKMNDEWSKLPPREQERIKAKIISEMVAEGAVGAGGAAAIKKAGKITEVLDIVAEHSSNLAKSGKNLAKTISNTVESVMAPEYAVAGGGKWKVVAAADEALDMTVMESRQFTSKFDPRHRLKPIEAARENARIKKVPFDEKEWENLKPKEKAERLVKDGYELLEDPEPLPPFDSTKVAEAFRGDSNVFSRLDKAGQPKSYINADGDLVPASLDGIYDNRKVELYEHLLGNSHPDPKACSPFTSVGTSGVVYKYADGSGIKINMIELRKAIASGEVAGVNIIEHQHLKDYIESLPGDKLSGFRKELARRYVNYDNEFIIQGKVPAKFIELLGATK